MKRAFKFYFIITITVVLCMSGCKSKSSNEQKTAGLPDATAIDLDPRLKDADSLVVVFYKDPYGADSLRYTRFYTQASVTDTKGLAMLQKEARKIFNGQEKRRSCRSEGKVWCFAKGKSFRLFISVLVVMIVAIST